MPSQKQNISHYKSNDNREKNHQFIYYSANFSCSLYKLQLKSVQTTREVCTDFAEVWRLGNLAYTLSSTLTKTLVACSQNKDTKYISHNLSIMNTYSQFSVIRLNKYDLHN